jgi:hypothetical protein
MKINQENDREKANNLQKEILIKIMDENESNKLNIENKMNSSE